MLTHAARLFPLLLLMHACRSNTAPSEEPSANASPDAAVDPGPTGATGATGGWFDPCSPDLAIPCQSCTLSGLARILAGASAVDCGTAPSGSPNIQAIQDCAARNYLQHVPFISTIEQHSTDTDGTEVLVGRRDGGVSLLRSYGVGSPGFKLIEAVCPLPTVDGDAGQLTLTCGADTFCQHCVGNGDPCP
jgi:hypothetical protein